MKFSEKSAKHIDSCRFCWMCRHICPIAIATGLERNTSRARALSLSLVVRGAEQIGEVADNLFECALCGACVKECVTGWDPVMFTREARTIALLDGAMPEYIEKLLINLEEKGNVYGKDLPDYIKERKGNKTLLFLGEDARFMSRDSYTSATAILDKAGVNYDVRPDEVNSGASVYFMTGKSNESKTAMELCAKFINEYDEVIVYDPQDYKLFVREFKEFGIDVSAKVELYKAGHHGSKTSSNDCLLDVIKPKICVVCCCAGTDEYTDTVANQFPTQDFIDRISKHTDKVYVPLLGDTDYTNGKDFAPMNGNIKVISNATGVSVNCSNNDVLLKDTDWFKNKRITPTAWATPVA